MQMLIRYVLAMIAGIWMADGLALLVAPRQVMAQVRDVLAVSPKLLSWEGLAVALGVSLFAGTRGFQYDVLWAVTGGAMVAKGMFLMTGPDQWRHNVRDWCLRRDDIDYRFWGIGLCALSVLLLHASGWIGVE
jgi:uncharacterized protein YjeT (DUF2065 family)